MNNGKAQLSLIGTVRDDPVLRKLPTGKSVTSVTIDVPTKSGDVLYFAVEVFGEDADRVVDELQSGSMVVAEARAVRRSWTDKVTKETRSRVGWKAISIIPISHDDSGDRQEDCEDELFED